MSVVDSTVCHYEALEVDRSHAPQDAFLVVNVDCVSQARGVYAAIAPSANIESICPELRPIFIEQTNELERILLIRVIIVDIVPVFRSV